MGRCRRRMSWSLTSLSLARTRLEMVMRRSQKPPLLNRPGFDGGSVDWIAGAGRDRPGGVIVACGWSRVEEFVDGDGLVAAGAEAAEAEAAHEGSAVLAAL